MNRAFLLLLDWEYTKDPFEESLWILINSSNLPDEAPRITRPPIGDLARNDFAGFSLDAINTFVRSHESKLETLGMDASIWLIIDQKGIDDDTCLVVEQVTEYGSADEEIRRTDKFGAARLPYMAAHSMCVNLSIANMDFEDFVDEDAGVQSDGAYKHAAWLDGEAQSKELKDKRDAALNKLRGEGHVE